MTDVNAGILAAIEDGSISDALAVSQSHALAVPQSSENQDAVRWKLAFSDGSSEEADSNYVSYGAFTMDKHSGLTKAVQNGRGKNATLEEVWICSPLEILGHCRNPHRRAWGKYLRFHDADQSIHLVHVLDAMLQRDPAAVCASLAHEGLQINASWQKLLIEYLNGVAVDQRVTVVPRTGYVEIGEKRVFVLPGETIGAIPGETVVLESVDQGRYEAQGSLEDWKQGVGRLTRGHKLAVFAVNTALAGALARVVDAEGGGVHLFAETSTGKSTLLQAAASVWGRGDARGGFVRTWRSTANALEGAAASSTDTCLVLDEIGVAEARDVAAATYQLANGSGKGRAGRDGSLRESKSWSVEVLSSGEVPLETKLSEERGHKTRGGQLIRFLDISADGGLGFGVFDHAGGYSNAGLLADAIKAEATSAFGTAGPEFVRRLMALGTDKVRAEAKEAVGRFVHALVPAGASDQIVRAAKKFALIALAGELATMFGITPWEKGEARRAARWAFECWVEKRGGTGSYEEKQAIEHVRLIIEQFGDSRFEGSGFAGMRDRLGWRRGEAAAREWWIPPEIWKAEFCPGRDPVFVARTLASRGFLRRQDDKHIQRLVKLPDGQSVRVYVLTAAILD